MKERASMNRTITLTDDERYTYKDYISDHFEVNENAVIQGDFFIINKQSFQYNNRKEVIVRYVN